MRTLTSLMNTWVLDAADGVDVKDRLSGPDYEEIRLQSRDADQLAGALCYLWS